jgi:histidine triad (HIT) family protein
LDISPINSGHTLVVPLRHVASFTDLTLTEVHGMFRMAHQVASALKSAFPDCEGVTISMADGEVAGQEVPHAHIHVIPRHRDDGFGWRRFGKSMDRPQLNSIASQIRSSMPISNDPND